MYTVYKQESPVTPEGGRALCITSVGVTSGSRGDEKGGNETSKSQKENVVARSLLVHTIVVHSRRDDHYSRNEEYDCQRSGKSKEF